MQWTVLVVRLPAEPSRHRVAVWRELRRTGAVSLGQSAWLAPAAPAFADGIARAVAIVRAAGGEAIVLDASGRQPADAERLAAVYTAAREASGSSSCLSVASIWPRSTRRSPRPS